ncbi:riboflavin synthase domain-like protein [Cantharellus anzutake]|uniref:riboflavin synthase domain-like protein n=1 Tax=Cantharellus anzutake TaxID=1750568 RepID=UPI001905347F|nr:riboflavin synthase domain-like protein [Cantharellus anzutake]KAF8322810.1 riboflavin synthase domain-like protein [Cantharellus anzutake]
MAAQNGLDSSSILILFATETGTSQDVAERIGRLLRRSGFRARIASLDGYSPSGLLEEDVVIFVCSTTGNGDEPHEMTSFWKQLLRVDLTPDMFEHLDIAVFGLGDSSYERFCWATKRLYRRLLSLGAHAILPRADADEQHYLGIYGTLDPWLDDLLKRLNELYDHSAEASSPSVYIKAHKARLLPCPSGEEFLDISRSCSEAPADVRARVIENKRITRSDWYQDVRHVELEIQNAHNNFQPGDVITLRPQNEPSDVDYLLSRMRWKDHADAMFEVVQDDEDDFLPTSLPKRSSLRDLLLGHIDIASVPRRSFFEACREYTSDERELDRLKEFSSSEGQDDLFEYAQRPRRTILEVLADFKSTMIPIEYVLDIFPTIRPRKFSISNSSQVFPGRVQLTVAIVRYRSLSLKVIRRGLCSTWLSRLQIGDKVSFAFQQGNIVLPNRKESSPVILIGPGTGLAPLRAIIQHRIDEGQYDNLLYFGCRSASADYLYREELEGYVANGHLRLRLAFSRDQVIENLSNKIYVQDIIPVDRELIREWIILRRAYVYLSGSSNKMPAAVRLAIRKVLEGEGEWTEAQSRAYMTQMESEGRWFEETWS